MYFWRSGVSCQTLASSVPTGLVSPTGLSQTCRCSKQLETFPVHLGSAMGASFRNALFGGSSNFKFSRSSRDLLNGSSGLSCIKSLGEIWAM